MAVTQYYIVEIHKYEDGTFGQLVHVAYDEDPVKAKDKAESKYHEVLSAAAISSLPSHAAIMFNTNGVPMLFQHYEHYIEPVENTGGE